MIDPQSSIAIILKPPRGFEQVYQGIAHTTPIPLVAANQRGDFVFLDDFAGKPGLASNLARFVPVPFASTIYILLPRPFFVDSEGEIIVPTYAYELRWRFRTLSDWTLGAGKGNATHPWMMIPQTGRPAAPASTPEEAERTIFPSFVSEVVTPTMLGSTNRPLVAMATFGTSSQGYYAPAGATAGDGNLALGPICFPPILRPSLGNELSICIVREGGGNWDFSDVTADGDAALSLLYGTDIAGENPNHEFFPGIGAILATVSRSTTP